MLVCTKHNHCPQGKDMCCVICEGACEQRYSECVEEGTMYCVFQQCEVDDDVERPMNELDEYRMQEGKGEL